MKDFVKGKDPIQKFKSINATLNAFQRRLQKKVVAIVPPIPIFGYTHEPDQDGIIMQSIIPASGSLVRLCMGIREYSSQHTKTVKFSCGVTRTGGRLFHDFETRKAIVVEDISVDVETGDLLEISVEDPSYVRGISVSLLYRVNVAETQIHNAMIEELDKIAEIE